MKSQDEYRAILELERKLKNLEKERQETSKVWVDAAVAICREYRPDIVVTGTVRFEETKFHVSCRGTGIYSEEEWWETFAVGELFVRIEEVGS